MRVSQGRPGSLLPLFPFKIALLPMLPHVFLICSPFNKFAYHLSTPSIPSRQKKQTPKTKLIKEDNRLYVTFNLCDTSSQASERKSQSIRVGWALKPLSWLKISDRHQTTAALSRIGSYMAFRASL